MKTSEKHRLSQIEMQKDQIMIDFFRNSLGYSEEEIRHRLSKATTAELQNNTMGGFGLLQGAVDHIGAKIDAANKLRALENDFEDQPNGNNAGTVDSSENPSDAKDKKPTQGRFATGISKLRTAASAGIGKVRNALGMPSSKSLGKSSALETFRGFTANDVKFIDSVAREFFKSTTHLDIMSDNLYKSFGIDNRPARYLEAERRVRSVSHATDLFWLFNTDVFNKSLHVLPYLSKKYAINPFEFVEFLQKAVLRSSPAGFEASRIGGNTLASKILDSTGTIQDFFPEQVLEHAIESSKGRYDVSRAGKGGLERLLGKHGIESDSDQFNQIVSALKRNGSLDSHIDHIDRIDNELFSSDPLQAQAIKDELKDALRKNQDAHDKSVAAPAPASGTKRIVPLWIETVKKPKSVRSAYAEGTVPGKTFNDQGEIIDDTPTANPDGHYDHDTGRGDTHSSLSGRQATPFGVPVATGKIVNNDSARLFHKLMTDGWIVPLDLSVSGTHQINLHGSTGANGEDAKKFRASWGYRPKMVPDGTVAGTTVHQTIGGVPQYEPLGSMETPMWHSGDIGVKSDRWSWASERDPSTMSVHEASARAEMASRGLGQDQIDKLIENFKRTGSIDSWKAVPDPSGASGSTIDVSDTFAGGAGTDGAGRAHQKARAHRVGFLMRNPSNPSGPLIAVEWDPAANGGTGQYVAGLHHSQGALKYFGNQHDASGAIVGNHGAETSYDHTGLQHFLTTLSAAAPAWSMYASTTEGRQPYGVRQENTWTVTKNGSVDTTTSRNRLSDAINMHLHPTAVGASGLKSLSGLAHEKTGPDGPKAAQAKSDAAASAFRAGEALHRDDSTAGTVTVAGDQKVSDEIHSRIGTLKAPHIP